MVSYALLAIVEVFGILLCREIFHGHSVLSAGRRRPAFCTLWGGRAERYLPSPPAVCFSLVCMMYLINIIIVVHQYVRLYWHVPHCRIASAISATFRALGGALRRLLAPPRGGA